jgi:membrane-bound lytic murein transglycosylase D
MEVLLRSIRRLLTRARARLLFPALATAAGLATLVGGLERTSFLNGASSPTSISSPALVSDSLASSTVAPDVPLSAGSAAGSRATLNVHVQHARIDRWVQQLTTSHRGDFQQSLGRMDRYSEMITTKLDERQMPRELVYLAMIESNFNPTARSRVSAVGLWQFMSGTAKQFGLSVGRRVDERKDPVKATDAALTYLSQLHDRFGSWYLAAAAYNSGPGTVSKALRTVTGKTQGTDDDFFRILHALPRETQDYVPKLIASARVGSAPAQYGL